MVMRSLKMIQALLCPRRPWTTTIIVVVDIRFSTTVRILDLFR